MDGGAALKEVVLCLLLKKTFLDPAVLDKYYSVNNLPLLKEYK